LPGYYCCQFRSGGMTCCHPSFGGVCKPPSLGGDPCLGCGLPGTTKCGRKCCPKGQVCCSQKSGVCCKTKAACCGSDTPGATNVPRFCCRGSGNQGPVCVSDKYGACCRPGEEVCVGRYEEARYPCCPRGTTCCGSECADTQRDPRNCGSCGNVCASGVCGGGICALP
jgi:hypothetical protein